MDSKLHYNKITIETLGEKNQIEFAVRLTEGPLEESVLLKVLVPRKEPLSVLGAQEDAVRRAIQLLQMTLKDWSPEG
ncbi:MAG: hypothetical protein K0R43_1726 [Pseudoduganella sp.]|jgi:hypothetical protein|nr:hypothetical protein [Pseudoduganella sp.]